MSIKPKRGDVGYSVDDEGAITSVSIGLSDTLAVYILPDGTLKPAGPPEVGQVRSFTDVSPQILQTLVSVVDGLRRQYDDGHDAKVTIKVEQP